MITFYCRKVLFYDRRLIMKVLVLSLAALTFVSGAFGAGRVHTSPTNSVKAKKVLEGPEAAQKLLLEQNAPEGSKQSKLLGSAKGDASAKVLENLKRKAKALKSELDQADKAAKEAHKKFVDAAILHKADEAWVKGEEAQNLSSDLDKKNEAFFKLDKNYRKFQQDNPLVPAAA